MVKKYLVSSTIICLASAPMLKAEESSDLYYTPTAMMGEPLDPCCINPVYPYPANISLNCGWDLYVSGEFVYFSNSKDVFPAAVFQTAFDGSESILLPSNTSYRPGFRVSCGLDLGSVVLDATYLRYHPHNTSHFNAEANTALEYVFPEPNAASILFGQAIPVFQTVKSSLHLSVDTLVVSLQRPVYLGKRILMNLNYGIRASWLGENWEFNATALEFVPPLPLGTSDGITKLDHKIWGVGPNLGVTATALLPWHFQLVSKLNLALEYSEAYKIFLLAAYPDLPVLGLPSFLGNNTIREKGKGPHMQVWHEGEIGLGWGKYLCCDRYHVNISLSYNWILNHSFWLAGAQSPFGTDLGTFHNISMHGISVGGRLDF